MSAMSDYLENKIVDHVFRGQAYTIPVLYVGLLTAAPSDSGGGTEISGNAYARVKAAASTAQALTDWKSTQNDNLASATGSGGTTGNTTNTNAVTFPTPSATWGTVTHFGIYDALTAGNLLFWGSLTISKTINQSDTVTFPAGTLSITFA
jgi:hypothetical protein